jgi:5'-phosphate synthase pdxT subunit
VAGDVKAGVLALQGDVREHAAALERSGASAIEVRLPGDLDGIDVLVLPGGESTTIGKLADRYGLIDPLRERISAGLPTLGTCAGMIFLAGGTTSDRPQHHLGVLDIVVARNAFGRQVASFEADLEITGFDTPFPAVFIRAPWVAEVGEGIAVMATVDDHPVMVRKGTVVATSFHPELTGDDRVHTLILDMAREA